MSHAVLKLCEELLKCEQADPQIVKGCLGELSAQDLNTQGFYVSVILARAINTRNSEIVRQVLAAGIDPNIICGDNPALLHAVVTGDIKIVGLLLDYKANINVTDHQGTTALMEAATLRDLPMVRFLMRKDEDLDVKDQQQLDVIDRAREAGAIDIIMAVMQEKKDRTQRQKEQELKQAIEEACKGLPYDVHAPDVVIVNKQKINFRHG